LLDGLVAGIQGYSWPETPIYTRKEIMLDVEKVSFYYPSGRVHTLTTYFDPRRDKEHKNPKMMRAHTLSTQLESFLLSQMDLSFIENREHWVLDNFVKMKPQLLYYDFVMGFWHTNGWQEVFPAYPLHTGKGWGFLPGEEWELNDLFYARKQLKIGKYDWKGLDLKFYRIRPEEVKDHALKYPYGFNGLTKCEICTPILIDIPEEGIEVRGTLTYLQVIRRKLLGNVWNRIIEDVARKVYARTDKLFPWSSTDQPLQGSEKAYESELTQRRKVSVEEYLKLLQQICEEKETT